MIEITFKILDGPTILDGGFPFLPKEKDLIRINHVNGNNEKVAGNFRVISVNKTFSGWGRGMATNSAYVDVIVEEIK